MRIAYLLSLPLTHWGGVEKKIEMQVHAWRKSGHHVDVHAICSASAEFDNFDGEKAFLYRKKQGSFLERAWSTWTVFQEACQSIAGADYDLVYYRLSYPTPPVIRLATKKTLVAEVNNNIVAEIQRNFGNRRVKCHFLLQYLRCFLPALLRRSCGIIAVTPELLEQDIVRPQSCAKIYIPNNIDLSRYPVFAVPEPRNPLPLVAFLGTSEHPNGIARILKLASLTEGKLNFRIFGHNMPEEAPSNVECIGFLDETEYNHLLGECDIGLSTLTFYEKGLKQAASLKIREYLARGLPVVLAYSDVAISGKDLDFVLQIPDSPDNVEVSIDDIVSFCQKNQGRRLSHENVANLVGSTYWEEERLRFFADVIKNKKS